MKPKAIIEVSPSRQIVQKHLAEIRATLIKAESAPDIKRIIDTTAILADAAKKAHLGLETVNEVQGIRLDAEIKLGHELIRAKKANEITHAHKRSLVLVSDEDKKCLSDFGISWDLSARTQVFAKYEKQTLRAANEILEAKEELSVLALFADIKRQYVREDKRKKLNEIAANEPQDISGVFDVLVIDPPWPMQKLERDVRPNQVEQLDYPVMSEQELLSWKLPIEKAANDCHVFLWATHKFLPLAFRCLEKWEAKYTCCFVWHKPGGFQPVNLPQLNCEFCLYAHYGDPQFLDDKAFNVCFEAPRAGHSEKPEEFYALLRRVTAGRRLDMFNRRPIEGFIGWGKEAPK